ncbi:MAG TPA: hypothetical protein PKA10_07885 [Selenomonadales bacterium]|nr:hypothetical protein [Selenomonadales bacterium]
MTIPINEIQIALAAAGIILAANVLAMLLFVLFARLPNGRLREGIRSIIYELDRAADNMENAQKRAAAITAAIELINWKIKILIPRSILTYLLGWVIDAEVAAIRRMQAATSCPDLHKEDDAK